ncbi:MAG: amino acid adenylation domain-containing protein [Pirellulaceae bacterium]
MHKYFYNVPQMFADVVRRYSDRPAIRFGGSQCVDYRRLDALSNQMARFLIDQGVRPGDRVGICLEKTLVPYVVVLGALKVGACYFALDPRSPSVRNRRILEQCGAKLVFSDNAAADEAFDSPVVRCDAWEHDFPLVLGYDASEVDLAAIDGSSPAYIMFTSGSTGTPKGAVISHANLLHFAHWARRQYRFTPEDRHTHLNPIYFDNSVFDIYSTLLSGGSLVPFTSDVLTDPAALVRRIEDMRCTVYFSVPSLLMYLQVMKQIRRDAFRSVRAILFGGEGYPKVKLKSLYDELKGQTELFNVYGPTECTCICSSYAISDADFIDLDGLPPLGELIPNFRGYLLDGESPVADGETAELCLGGPSVGLGYYGQGEQTRGAFVQNPLNPHYNETIYRTGDLVRRDPLDGKLYFVGRQDLQVKHQGYRVELEEIQHALLALEGVDEAVALQQKQDQHSRIVAIVAARSDSDPRRLKQQVAAHVPAYMVPDKIHVLDAMPKNANGKTDRQWLMRKYAA